MRNKQYSLKLAHIICFTLVLVLGLIGSSYAMWSESNIIIKKISTGSLLSDIELELPDSGCIVVTERFIFSENDKSIYNEQDENNDSEISENNWQNEANQSCSKEYYCNYNTIPFNIINLGTVPLKVEKCNISLNSINISHICSVEYEEANYIDGKLIIKDEVHGYIQIDSDKLEELAQLLNNGSDNISLTFSFRQSNLDTGGWIEEETIFIPVLKNSETIVIYSGNENNVIGNEEEPEEEPDIKDESNEDDIYNNEQIEDNRNGTENDEKEQENKSNVVGEQIQDNSNNICNEQENNKDSSNDTVENDKYNNNNVVDNNYDSGGYVNIKSNAEKNIDGGAGDEP